MYTILIDTKLSDINSIISHNCGCKIGLRIVGCCFHIALVLWYFSYARYLEKNHLPASHLRDIFEKSMTTENESEEDIYVIY